MAAAAAAALLDELMGRNRNVLPNEKPKEINWEDSEVILTIYYFPSIHMNSQLYLFIHFFVLFYFFLSTAVL